MKTTALVSTEKAARYMKALVNHFSRKIVASYEGNHGTISFDFGRCELKAENGNLIVSAESQNADNLKRMEQVIDSHLKRFIQDEDLTLTWSTVKDVNTA